jgi:DNA-binding NarL/FixJ family response regulator
MENLRERIMDKTIRVTILDDHQSIVDGYRYRLEKTPQMEVADIVMVGEDLEPSLEAHPADVLLLDISVPTSRDNPNPYPILHAIPQLLQKYPHLNILVISMFAERALIRSVVEAGASGYVLKEDSETIRDLGDIVKSVAAGGRYFSKKALQLYTDYLSKSEDKDLLTNRQAEALSLAAAYPDDTTADLARKMGVLDSTVRNLLTSVYVKLGVHTRAAAIAKARQMALITPEPPEHS